MKMVNHNQRDLCASISYSQENKNFSMVQRIRSIDATSYQKNNRYNEWFAKNRSNIFFIGQFTANVGLLTYALMEKDWYTMGTAFLNLSRNGYGVVSRYINKGDEAKNEKKDSLVMLGGAASNSVQALSFLGGSPVANAVAGGLATLTYLLRFGAYHLRKNGRAKELKANQKIHDLSSIYKTDNLQKYLENKSETSEQFQTNSKKIKRSKLMRTFSYNVEQIAATSFVTRGVMQFYAGWQKGNEVGMGTGGLFILGALGMLKGDLEKGKKAKDRCFYASSSNFVKRTKNTLELEL